MSTIFVTPLSDWALATALENVKARSAIQTIALDFAAIAAMQTVIASFFRWGFGFGGVIGHPL
jgi:hypothetical protein